MQRRAGVTITNQRMTQWKSIGACFSQIESGETAKQAKLKVSKMEQEKDKEKQKMKGSEERWRGAIANLMEMSSNLESLQSLLLKKAVFVDDDTFAKASLSSEQSRTIKVCLSSRSLLS